MTEMATGGGEGARTPQENGFYAQFHRQERVKVPGGIAKVIDLRPPVQVSDVSVFFASAWACTFPIYEPAFEELFNRGCRIISLEHPRHGIGFRGVQEKGDAGPRETTDDYPTEGLRRAMNILAVIDDRFEKDEIEEKGLAGGAKTEKALQMLVRRWGTCKPKQ